MRRLPSTRCQASVSLTDHSTDGRIKGGMAYPRRGRGRPSGERRSAGMGSAAQPAFGQRDASRWRRPRPTSDARSRRPLLGLGAFQTGSIGRPCASPSLPHHEREQRHPCYQGGGPWRRLRSRRHRHERLQHDQPEQDRPRRGVGGWHRTPSLSGLRTGMPTGAGQPHAERSEQHQRQWGRWRGLGTPRDDYGFPSRRRTGTLRAVQFGRGDGQLPRRGGCTVGSAVANGRSRR